MNSRCRWIVGAACVSLVCISITVPALADIVTLTPIKDNTLFEDEEGSLSNGMGQFIFAGVTNQSLRRRALIAFDVAGTIPTGSTIISTELTLNMSQTNTQNHGRSMELHRLLADWGEGASQALGTEGTGTQAEVGDATWIHRFFDPNSPTLWAAEGGDFSPTPSAVQIVDQVGSYTWGPDPDLTADVQSWLDVPNGNFGWALIGVENRALSAKRFDSRENDEEQNRPKLTVDFDLPGAPTRTATPTPTVTPTATPSLTPTETATPQPVPNQPLRPARSVLAVSLLTVAILVLSSRRRGSASNQK